MVPFLFKVTRLISVAAQKFVADIAYNALQVINCPIHFKLVIMISATVRYNLESVGSNYINNKSVSLFIT